MQITITKGERSDRIDIVRSADDRVSTTFPHKGPVPHDAVHFFVEEELCLGQGFWGMVADGRHPQEIAGIAKAAGHASASRAAIPDVSIVPILQAERIVECFEADLWSQGQTDLATLRATIEAGCASSFVPTPPVSDGAIARIRGELRTLAERWPTAPPGEQLTLVWKGDVA
jgi:hypothetical protein